ncbi:MAG: aldehyde dehydrogenase family protein [Verrucomicrobia bacterium]|nr:aldehyde dehydrogenase family protein [Verrucomicrobiota bacterium]
MSGPDSLSQTRRAWAELPVPERLRVIVQLRSLLVGQVRPLAAGIARIRGIDPSEAITTEILPLVEGCRFLEKEAAEILAPRRPGLLDRPLWLSGVRAEIRREPFGTVLILSPSNYPLFLAASQLLQALVAGNAVMVKPAPGASAPLVMLRQLLLEAGLPEALCLVLPEDPAAVHDLIRQGVDKVILTGGTATGRAVLQTCAEAIVPATVELSGVDAVHVLDDADPARAADLILYGLSLNQGRTCIAPRRLLVQRGVSQRMRTALQDRFRSRRAPLTELLPWVRAEVNAALGEGARLVAGAWGDAEGIFRYPLVLENLPTNSRLVHDDHFAPICCFREVADEEESIELDRACPYALGAAVFSRNARRGAAFAARLPAGSVTVNDLIVPTADPRLPFGGRGRSGFGVTRGAEGLLEMTSPRVISRRSGNGWLPHLDAPAAGDEERFAHLVNLLHGTGLIGRLGSLGYLLKQTRRSDRSNQQTRNYG